MRPTAGDGNKGGVNPPGVGPAQPREVEDPHPSNEEHYDRQERPGGARPPREPGGDSDDRRGRRG